MSEKYPSIKNKDKIRIILMLIYELNNILIINKYIKKMIPPDKGILLISFILCFSLESIKKLNLYWT